MFFFANLQYSWYVHNPVNINFLWNSTTTTGKRFQGSRRNPGDEIPRHDYLDMVVVELWTSLTFARSFSLVMNSNWI